MYQIPYSNITAWSDLEVSPGIMASLSKSEIEEAVRNRVKEQRLLPITLVVDNVRIPDNMGAILRLSAAVGVKKVITVKGCVDPWQPKCVRAGAGAHFRMPIETLAQWETIEDVLPKYAQVILADLDRSKEDKSVLDEKELSKRVSELQERCQELSVISEEDGRKRDYSYVDEDILAEFAELPLVSKPYDQVRLP